MEIKAVNGVSFGMKKIATYRIYDRLHPENVIETDHARLARANKHIKKMLAHLRRERWNAEKSASEIFLSV